MKNTLQETYFCDYEHPAIQKLAEKLSKRTSDPVEIAKKLFIMHAIILLQDMISIK